MDISPFAIETLAIGDELLTGRTSDTNTTFIGDQLFQLGFRLNRTTVILDDVSMIQTTVRECATRSRRVIVFGGLGPTSDDKTAEAIAQLLKCPLVPHGPSEERLRLLYAERKRSVTKQSLKQVLYPQSATPMMNPRGAAPGFHCDIDRCRFYFLPGVPQEMKEMFLESVFPEIEGLGGQVLSKTWRCLGIPESELQAQMDPVEATLPEAGWLGYRTRLPENHLTLYFRKTGGRAVFDNYCSRISEILKPWCYTQENRELEELIGAELHRRGWRIALGESCTGGLAVHRLTKVPGSSAYVWGGYTVYQLDAKAAMLGVTPDTQQDAVSAKCSRLLAEGVRAESGCEVSASITGYMGPGGGTEKDPIGTIFICVMGGTANEMMERRIVQWARTRSDHQWAAATHLLNAILQFLERQPLPT